MSECTLFLTSLALEVQSLVVSVQKKYKAGGDNMHSVRVTWYVEYLIERDTLHRTMTLPCKDKRQYLLTLQVNILVLRLCRAVEVMWTKTLCPPTDPLTLGHKWRDTGPTSRSNFTCYLSVLFDAPDYETINM